MQAEEKKQTGKENPFRNIRIEKLVVNICVGESGDRLTKAARVLKDLTDQEPCFGVGTLQLIASHSIAWCS